MMKKKAKIRLKRTVAFVLCMMMASSILVANAETNGCSHLDARFTEVTKIIEGYNEGQHTARYTDWWECPDCHTRWAKNIRIVTESHSMNWYTDEGHSGDRDHTYRLHCECGFSWSHTIYCSGGSSHAKPW